MTVADVLRKWLESHKSKIAGTTYDGYLMKVESHLVPALGAIKIKDLQPLHVETYFAKKREKGRKDGKKGGLSENTLKKHYVLLNKAMQQAVKWRLIKYNPVQAVDPPKKEKKEAKDMPKKDFYELMNVAKGQDPWLFNFLYFVLFTGVRRSEALGLEWKDVHMKDQYIHIRQTLVARIGGSEHRELTKNDSSNRKIKISEKTVKLLKQHKKMQTEARLQIPDRYNDNKDYVFCKENGYNYNPNSVNKKLKRVLKKTDISNDYGFHALRHSFATIQVELGTEPAILKEMMGHSTVATTIDIYFHGNTDMQKKATEKMDQTIDL